jgi:multimeric flavodoxin WrbA
MKLLIVNGIPEGDQYIQYEKDFEHIIELNSEHEIVYFKLRDMNINYCTGCWDCWLKTPGLCAIKDDQEEIIKYIPHVDHMIFMSPIIIGYESALLKKFKDRAIPVIHPYIRIHKGEQHHVQRYASTPDLTFIGITDANTIQEDIDLMRHTYERVSLNFDSTLLNFHTSNDIGGVANVFSNI